MNLKDINFKKAYSSDFDNILFDFYIPTLECSIEYERLAGFFSSTSLAVAARGILGLIKNGGKMKLIASPKLQKSDLEIMINTHEAPEKFMEKIMLEELEKLEDEFVRNHLFALGWMIANKKLEIKVAIAYNDEKKPCSYEEIQYSGLFHQKVGILKDLEGNIISFSGSVNETASGWLGNIEEFKVFRNWDSSEEDYVKADILKFNKFWDNQSPKLKVINISHAIEKKFIEIAPPNIERIQLNKLYNFTRKKISLFNHQKEAVEFWIQHGMKCLFEMATGTGKTFAALGCVEKVTKTTSKLCLIITTPNHHLIQQWKREIDIFGIKYDDLIIADSSNSSWKDNFVNSLIDLSLGYKNKIITLTTHSSFSSEDFINIIQNNTSGLSLFVIADEVHGLGAEKSKRGFLNEYVIRLGLSATSRRWFDDLGTAAIYDYFGNEAFEFGLDKAITTINPKTGEYYLTPYRYLPIFISLDDDEFEEYVEKTKKIARKFNQTKDVTEKDIYLENLIFKRADIIKNAKQKISVLGEILNQIDIPIKWTIIYCSPQQISHVMDIINNRKIIAHRFTMEEGIKPDRKYDGMSEREFILNKFEDGTYQVLVAMKCLDEGVDVPPARRAILLASSGNPREYIQRIGRVIRRYKDKSEATIYDIIVIPSFGGLPHELREIECKIFEKEIKRYDEIAKIAINSAEAFKIIFQIKNRLMGAKNE